MSIGQTASGLMSPTGPIAITQGQASTLEPPGVSNNAWTWVVLSNQSPMACKVVTPAGPAQWLQPFSADKYFVGLNGPEEITITPVFQTTSATTGSVLADWYEQEPPGYYPMALISQAVIASITGAIQAEITNTPTVDIAAGAVTITGTPTVDIPQGDVNSGPQGVNPSFTIREVSAYSYGFANNGAAGTGGLIGAPSGGLTKTELHAGIICNNSAANQAIYLQTTGGLTFVALGLAPFTAIPIDFKGLTLTNLGVQFQTASGPGACTLTYTWR